VVHANQQLLLGDLESLQERPVGEQVDTDLAYNQMKTAYDAGVNFFDNAEGADTHSNMMQPQDVAKTLGDIIETPDNLLINELVMRPLNPKPPEDQ
jgi:NADP-dependent 3-hydroxy acid dehydrogenase YdfG